MGDSSLEPGWLPGLTPASSGGEGVLYGTSVGWEMGFAGSGGGCPSPLHPHLPLPTPLWMTEGSLLSPAAEGGPAPL